MKALEKKKEKSGSIFHVSSLGQVGTKYKDLLEIHNFYEKIDVIFQDVRVLEKKLDSFVIVCNSKTYYFFFLSIFFYYDPFPR